MCIIPINSEIGWCVIHLCKSDPNLFAIIDLPEISIRKIRFIEDLSRLELSMASSSSSVQKNFKYQVFLSFRGEDTRKKFVGHLYGALTQKGIYTFRDTDELEKGKEIGKLFDAIKESNFFLIVFSENYTSSSWCLNELVEIMECQETTQRTVYPLFYDVDPADVRKQTGKFGEAFDKQIRKFGETFDKHDNEHVGKWEQVGKWREALTKAGHLVGWDLRNRDEAEAINEIVQKISVELGAIHLSDDENLVGMESRMQDLESSLGLVSDDGVRMIGIKGMGGIGKTTLARAIFNRISYQFDGTSFVENVRKNSEARGGLLSLQRQVLADVLKDGSMHYASDCKSVIKQRLPNKKVLLVLDDVNRGDQLEELAGATDWFERGSRIIITTRDEQVLRAHKVIFIHDVNYLSEDDAICLFSQYAFKRSSPDQGYEELSSKVVQYSAGLPLTIKVLGSSLCGKKKPAWEEAIDSLKTIPCEETLDKLKISYDSLNHGQKGIFLDVACFMKGLRKEDAIRILKSRGFRPIIGLEVLVEKSLVTLSNQRLGMHDSIEELGRDIVRRSYPDEPNKHSRLWIREEIEELLSNDHLGTEAATTCIRLEPVELSPKIVMKGLGNLKKLRVLLLSGADNDDSSSDWNFDQFNFPNALQFLNWEGYPSRSLPQQFRGDFLVGLELPHSRIMQLWESREKKVLKKLKYLDLSYSKLKTLDLEICPNLERLDLKECHDLIEIRVPDGYYLQSLVYLNLIGCSRFKSFSFVKRLESLELLSLPKLEVIVESEGEKYSRDNLPELGFTCSYLEEQPSSTGDPIKSVFLNIQPSTKLESVSGSICGQQHLRHLTFHGCIPDVPEDLDQLAYLEKLNFLSTHIKCLPDSICTLTHLKSLKLVSCLLLEKLPEDLGKLESLEELILTECKSLEDIPDSICTMQRLKYFHLPHCTRVEKLPGELGQLKCLRELNVKDTGISHLPQSISFVENLRIVGSEAVLQSCAFTSEIETSETETFCYTRAVINTPASTENNRKRSFADHEATNTRGDST